MRSRALLPLILLAAVACSRVDSAITRASWKESFRDLWRGKDAGVYAYASDLADYTTSIDATGRYQYADPAYVSNFLVHRTVQKLGASEPEDASERALIVDRLFYVLARDPTAAVRATAAAQLGNIALELKPEESEILPAPPEPGVHADAHINQIVDDLEQIRQRIRDGERVKESEVVERMIAMSKERPATFLSAQQMMRALAREPIAGAVPGGVTAAADEIVPVLARDCILIALREVACGSRTRGGRADPDPQVRVDAARAMVRTRSPYAVNLVARQLKDPVDPAERDPRVRRHLVEYLGWAGGPIAFEICVRRLNDLDSGVRFYADGALRRMTGSEVRPTAEAWSELRQSRPDLQLGETEGLPE